MQCVEIEEEQTDDGDENFGDDGTFNDEGGFDDDGAIDDDSVVDDDRAFDDDGGRQLRLLHARHLQTCPFKEDRPESPCSICGNNFGTQDCEFAIVDYCSIFYEFDALACADYLDLYVDCNYHVLAPEIDDVFARAVTEGRNGLGTIYGMCYV